jgi:hypothetical protein
MAPQKKMTREVSSLSVGNVVIVELITSRLRNRTASTDAGMSGLNNAEGCVMRSLSSVRIRSPSLSPES